MQEKLHDDQRVQTRCDIIEHDPGTFGKLFQLADGRGLRDVKGSKKYKTREESFPFQWGRNKSDELASHFVDHDELRIFLARGS